MLSDTLPSANPTFWDYVGHVVVVVVVVKSHPYIRNESISSFWYQIAYSLDAKFAFLFNLY